MKLVNGTKVDYIKICWRKQVKIFRYNPLAQKFLSFIIRFHVIRTMESWGVLSNEILGFSYTIVQIERNRFLPPYPPLRFGRRVGRNYR